MSVSQTQAKTAAVVVDFLNSLLEVDREAVAALIRARVPCNDALANHPTVQVGIGEADGAGFVVGLLGLLNGMIGVDDRSQGYLVALFDDDALRGFQLRPIPTEPTPLDVDGVASLVPTRPKVYLASRYSRYVEMQGYRTDLEAMGFEVTSRWINGDHQVSNDALAQARHEERISFATEDMADLMAAEIVVAFTEEPRTTNSRGGRHVELGMALAAGKRVLVAVWRENVFCCLPQVEFCPGGWDEVKEALGPCDACGCVPRVGVEANLMALCRPRLDGCKLPDDEAA